MDNLCRSGLIILLIFTILISFAYFNRNSDKVKIIRIPDPNYVQNIGEAQRRLKAQGLYDGPIDYKWGAGTEKAYCDYCAIRSIKGE